MDPFALLTVLIGGFSILVPLCIGGVVIAVFALVGVIVYRNIQRNRTAQNAALSWPDTPGVILASNVVWQRGANSTSYQNAVVMYEYKVSGQTVRGQKIHAGEQLLKVSQPGSAQTIVSHYPVGAAVTVVYNPADPADSALER